jgi:hypothetical protein
MLLFSYHSISVWGFIMFCIVLRVLNDTFICVSLKSFVIFFVSLPMYMKVVHLVFWCCGSVFFGMFVLVGVCRV